MAIHFLDPNDEPGRLCHCRTEAAVTRALREKRSEPCPHGCNGSGTLPGNPDGARVEVWMTANPPDYAPFWAWEYGGEFCPGPINECGTAPTEAAALEAARQAWREASRV